MRKAGRLVGVALVVAVLAPGSWGAAGAAVPAAEPAATRGRVGPGTGGPPAGPGQGGRLSGDSRPWSTGRVVVRYRRGVGAGARRLAASQAGATRRAPLAGLGAEVLTTRDAAGTIRRLRGRDEVLWAELEQRRYPMETPTQAHAELSVPTAWAAEPRMRGGGVEVAVIDDGVDPTNPDLSASGKVVDGGDCSGDACLLSGGTTPSGPHGTAVAAVLAAGEDGEGVVGVAPDATVVAYKVFPDGVQGATNTAVANALLAAAARPSVRVVNLSLGSRFASRVERDALAAVRASRTDLVVVASAGNDGRELPNFPAGLAGVLSVGASERAGDGRWAVADFSNRGDVDVLAPGVAVPSWWEGSLMALDGTSFAAPAVAGVAAGLAAVGVIGDRARAAIVAGAQPPVEGGQVAAASGAGRADMLEAVTLATGPAAYVALTLTGGSHVANLVGRRSVEQLRFEPGPGAPEGAVPLTATRGSVGAAVVGASDSVAAGTAGATGLAAPGGVLTRARVPYAVPSANQGAVDATVAAAAADDVTRPLPLRLSSPTQGPEGVPAVHGMVSSATLAYGSVSRHVRWVSLPARARLTLEVTMPAPGADLIGGFLLVWAPAASGGTADPDAMFSDLLVGDGRMTYATPRAGRYAFGVVAHDQGGTGGYTLRATWLPRATAQSAQWPVFYPRRDGYRDRIELRFRPDQRLARARVDVFGPSGRRVWSKRVGEVAAGALAKASFAGRTSGGARLRAGRYSFSVAMVTRPGLGATTGRKRFALSWRSMGQR